MKNVSLTAVLGRSVSSGTATVATGRSVGKGWSVSAGALAWAETQMAQGLAGRCASAWACVASSPANTSRSRTHIQAIRQLAST